MRCGKNSFCWKVRLETMIPVWSGREFQDQLQLQIFHSIQFRLELNKEEGLLEVKPNQLGISLEGSSLRNHLLEESTHSLPISRQSTRCRNDLRIA
jgi:hypothetical protein